MNDRYFAGVDIYQKNGRSRYAICIFDAKNNQVAYVSQKLWVVLLLMWLCRVRGVRVIKEANQP